MVKDVETVRENHAVAEFVQHAPGVGTIVPRLNPPWRCTSSASDTTAWGKDAVPLPFPRVFYTLLVTSDCSRDSGCLLVFLLTCRFSTTQALP